MQTKKITFEHLSEFVQLSNHYVRSLPEKTKTPLSVKIEKISPSLKKALSEYQSKCDDIRVDFCSVDGDGNLIIKEGAKGEDRYTFKPEKLKKMKEEIKKLDKEEVSIDVNIAGSIPKDLSYLQVKCFRGIIIPVDYVYPYDTEENESKTVKDPEEVMP